MVEPDVPSSAFGLEVRRRPSHCPSLPVAQTPGMLAAEDVGAGRRACPGCVAGAAGSQADSVAVKASESGTSTPVTATILS